MTTTDNTGVNNSGVRGIQSAHLPIALSILLLVLVVYCLSIGPVAYMVEKTALRDTPYAREIVRTVYAPLVWLHHNTILREPLESYLKMWGSG